ncbi:unnamed protein product [Thelazia callipaeda]|uniref:Alpha-amylase n=1 Tax=Thelazia callipaeda TaxID=103827 RepID=A0A0N5CYY6_THECL|nr:unnamed protein product [Thelazia callipaeda]
MVHLFEWKWTDVAKECEEFLQHYGYGAVQVSPPQEHVYLTKSDDFPWWARYQPVSYKLSSRSGNRTQFIDMVNRCNQVKVRIVVDVVLNHMTGIGMKKGSNGVSSTGDSDFDARAEHINFPGVPYTKVDTNDHKCNHDIADSDYTQNVNNVRNCRLVGLIDINQGSERVRSKIVEYLNDLIDIGVAGFRFDASKHMWPHDLKVIIQRVKNLRVDIFGANQRPFVVHEVIDRGNEAAKAYDYLEIGRYTDFTYGALLTAITRYEHKDFRQNFQDKNSNFVHKIPKSFKKFCFSDLQWWGPGYGYGSFESHDLLVFIDNHDNQRDSNPYVLTYKDESLYAMLVGFMLSWNYGYPRVMSSYVFNDFNKGPPNHGVQRRYEIKSPEFEIAYKTCNRSSGWVCEHRWQAIRGMTLFRQNVMNTGTKIQYAQGQRLAFSRGTKGFFAVNNDADDWTV